MILFFAVDVRKKKSQKKQVQNIKHHHWMAITKSKDFLSSILTFNLAVHALVIVYQFILADLGLVHTFEVELEISLLKLNLLLLVFLMLF